MRLGFVAIRVTAGPRSLMRYIRLSRVRRHTGSGGKVVRLRLRPLRGREVLARPSTSDVDTIWGTFAGRYHLPPPEAGSPRVIWDLGANIGLTMADLAERFPNARVIGVELDGENAELARANTAVYGDRCEVIEAAVAPLDGQLRYVRLEGATSGHHLTDAPMGADPSVTPVQALSPFSLLALEGPGARVDYAKMDVEGAERQLLTENAGWTKHVRTVNVEVHEPYTVEECRADLEALGFETRVDPRHWACVVGVRPEADILAPSATPA